jgi:hypothetical protein
MKGHWILNMGRFKVICLPSFVLENTISNPMAASTFGIALITSNMTFCSTSRTKELSNMLRVTIIMY